MQMQKRSIARKASVAARHAMLKWRKRLALKGRIKGLQGEIRKKDKERLFLISELRASKSKVLEDIAGKRDAEQMQETYAGLVSDTGREQARLENSLKRKMKQLESLGKRKRR